MQKIDAGPTYLLHTIEATRQLERQCAAQLPPHTLMQRAGLAAARLALAIAPHARSIWIACGPGDNGGDGLQAASHLQQWGKRPVVTWLGDPAQASADTRQALQQAQQAGVVLAAEPPQTCELGLDALLGIGLTRAPDGALAQAIAQLNSHANTVLALDTPSGLNADHGNHLGPCVRAHHTLSLLTLKPGLFTGAGRDHCGQIWFDDLGTSALDTPQPPASAELLGAPPQRQRLHDSHKGSYGTVAVVGGASGMTGAATLAARAALYHGAGRVFLSLLDPSAASMDANQAELMLRAPAALDFSALTVVAGCGGGQAIAAQLPRLLSSAPMLVLDADALNAIATDRQLATLLRARQSRQRATVLTPHPLEAARLLGCSVAQIQDQRSHTAQTLSQEMGCTVVLKGSGTMVASPSRPLGLNPTGNAALATAGTGDVLAGMVGAYLAQGLDAHSAAAAAVYQHGWLADQWPKDRVLTAGQLAQAGA